MPMDLTSESGEEFSWGFEDWGWVLLLAEAYGWEAAGAVPVEEQSQKVPSRRVGYTSNDGQKVEAADAAGLADALERMLADPQRQEVADRLAYETNEELDTGDDPIPPWEVDEDALGAVEDFIDFCRDGAFVIE